MLLDLNKNEREVLKLLSQNGRISDSAMAEKLQISTQAIGKIRKRLESTDFIKGYCTDINLEKLGINVFLMLIIRIKDKFWEDTKGEERGMKILKSLPGVMLSFIPSNSNISLITLRGFHDMKEIDSFFRNVRSEYNKYFEIIDSFTFSPDNFLCSNPRNLIELLLNEKEIKFPEKIEWDRFLDKKE